MARKFRGSEEIKVDGKGRMSVPAKFRRIFEARDPDWKEQGDRAQLVVVYGPDAWNWLELYTIEAIERIDEEIEALPRGSEKRMWLETLMNGQAQDAEIDPEGRLVLPAKLREKVGLTEAAFLTAKADYLQVWRPENYTTATSDQAKFQERYAPDFDPRSFLQEGAGASERDGA